MKEHNDKKIKIGAVTGSVGLKGEIKIFHNADEPEILLQMDSFYIENDNYEIENIRYNRKIPIIKLSGVDGRDAAEALDKKDIYVDQEQIPDLPDGSFYIKNLIGLNVIKKSDGSKVGIIKNVIPGSAHDTYEIETEDKKTLPLPAVTEFIIEVSPETNTMKVVLPEGIEDIVY